MSFKVEEVTTKPFDGQKPGTSGLRKRSAPLSPLAVCEHVLMTAQCQGFPTGGTVVHCRRQHCYSRRLQHYTENFVQAILDSIDVKDSTLVIGGDGRFFSPETVQTILKIGSANGVGKFIIGKDAILSTPAASNIIRKYKATGGILLTASHNPGGPNADFGIKYNVSNGGPAPENITNKMYEKTKTIKSYKVLKAPQVNSF